MRVFDFLFGCWHKRWTFPIRKKSRTYIVCLDCGKEFEYSWEKMKVLGERARNKKVRKTA